MTEERNEKRWVGLFVHIMEDGEILYQGRIISCDGDFVIRRYSFADGRPTDTIRLSPSELVSNCRFYENEWEWRRAGNAAMGYDLEWCERVDELLGLSGPDDPPPALEQPV